MSGLRVGGEVMDMAAGLFWVSVDEYPDNQSDVGRFILSRHNDGLFFWYSSAAHSLIEKTLRCTT